MGQVLILAQRIGYLAFKIARIKPRSLYLERINHIMFHFKYKRKLLVLLVLCISHSETSDTKMKTDRMFRT